VSTVAEGLSRKSLQGQGALAAVTLGSGVAILDGTIVNIALRTVGTELDASLAQLQWIVNGYMLTLSALILVGGSLADRLGRRRVYLIGIVWFCLASALCAAAQSPSQLVGARLLQGVGGALATPGALAIIQSSFREEDRPAAIGQWAGISGVATAIGPFLGGWLLDHGGWRWIFLVNIPLCIAVVVMCAVWVPESSDAEAGRRFDLVGAGLTALALGAITFALTGATEMSTWSLVLVWAVGVAALAAFVFYERRIALPLVPLSLFGNRVFSAANGMTFLVYGALAAVFLMLVLQLQVSSGFTPLESGLATLPVTVGLLLLSPRAAAISSRIGPRLPMTIGPLVCAAGVLLIAFVGEGTGYWLGVFPGMVLFALGLATLVSPLTATVLAAAPNRYAGVASGVNNAVARSGSLLAVAAIPALVGLSGDDYRDPVALTEGYRLAQFACAGLLAGGGIISYFGLGGRHAAPSLPPQEQPAPSP
jgi:EmrB/QacA subfamily drug resistance transporter